MNRLPPSLLYLVIYNATLKPSHPADPDDEDAEEQAHVLFYTANDHAVSRDRVLRQVGLAKALVNFTSMFGSDIQCESVHSQSRRMVLISPEPDYWIHACLELEKTSRPPKKEEKGKGKQQGPIYDYDESSLHDAALRARLTLGYEAFKLIHGSFTSLLGRLGREALELQLERFFTVWAWSWDLGKQVPFSDYLGTRVHPLSNQLIPLIDALEDKLPSRITLLVLASSCIVASRTASQRYPPALPRHLLSLVATKSNAAGPKTKDSFSEALKDAAGNQTKSSPPEISQTIKSGTVKHLFAGVPSINMNVNVDVRKWNWPGYLTFGIGHGANVSDAAANGTVKQAEGKEQGTNGATRDADHDVDKNAKEETESIAREAANEVKVDSQALQDALLSEAGSQAPSKSSGSIADYVAATETTVAYEIITTTAPAFSTNDYSSTQASKASPGFNEVSGPTLPPDLTGTEADCVQAPKLLEQPSRETSQEHDHHSPQTDIVMLPKLPSTFLKTFVHLPNDTDTLDTHRRLLRYLRFDDLLLALIPSVDPDDDALDDDVENELAERGMDLLERLKVAIDEEEGKIAAAFSSSPVQNVFQKSQHVIATPGQLNYTSTAFTATSWHLHEGRRALDLDDEIHEVFSRGQSPQDWHLVKRGLGTDLRGTALHGNVYMEIARKEASLTDVDNEIAAVIRRFVE